MRPAFIFLIAALLSGCVTPGSWTSDSRDYAVTTCVANPQEVALAQRRARSYLSRHPSSAGEARLLAVQVAYVSPSEVADLWIKLSRSQTSSSAYVQRKSQSFKLFCVLLIDRSTLLPLTRNGYILANMPARGAIARFGGNRALYIGTGTGLF